MKSENIDEKEKQLEYEYLSEVIEILNGLIEKYEMSGAKNKAKMIEDRRELLKETGIIRDFDDVINLSGTNRFVIESENKLALNSLKLNNLKKMKNSPYFGRIDFIEDGLDITEKIYLGMNSLYDEENYEFYIYDWRAPISSMYYDYEPGRAKFNTPDGVIEGELTQKRQYKITGGKMEYMFDSDLVIGDDILRYELSKPSAAAVKPVIASIQRTQNYAIRHDRFENVLVSGIAGSGKTTVGLHRLSYLLYKYRGAIKSDDIRIFSNNNIFNSYISGIIPELGEEDIPSLDFTDLIETHMHKKIKYKDMYEQIEFLSAEKEAGNARKNGILLKYTHDFLDFTANYIKNYSVTFNDIYFHDFKICGGLEINELYKDRTKQSDMRLRTERIINYLEQKFNEFLKERKKQIITFILEHYDEDLSDIDCLRIFNDFKNGIFTEMNMKAKPDAVLLYKNILNEYRPFDKKIYRETAATNIYNFEDALILFYIEILKGDIKKNNGIKHILIDEAQDLNLLQHKIILMLYPLAKYTVLADVNQALYKEITISDKNELIAIYSAQEKSPTVIELEKSYRQTFEISRFSSEILGVFSEENYFKRHGETPKIIENGNIDDCILSVVKEIHEKGYYSVGILTGLKQDALTLHSRLKKLTEISLIAESDAKFQSGTVIMPIAYAKGLEFDAVIIPGYKELQNQENKKILYLMCTRALHLLYLCV